MKRFGVVLTLAAGLNGCTSVGSLGIIAKSRTDMAALVRGGREFKELGPADGIACRHFLFAVFPWGNADIQMAVDNALEKSGGDALINVTTTNSLLGYIPIYNVYSQDCTTVRGTAIKFQ